MRWRSPREIAFRLNQEVRNAILASRPPRLSADKSTIAAPLPDPAPALDRLRGTPLAAAMLAEAEEALAHRFSLLGLRIETGEPIRWRRDYVNDRETEPLYFRRVPYLDVARAGDHKLIWELSRHQHLVLLAQAYRLNGDSRFLGEIQNQIRSWLEANPFQCGINWASALEVAFRALSWMWIDRLAGSDTEPGFRHMLREELYRHGYHLAVNLSVYFSPNTHLLGEGVALHALGRMFADAPAGRGWIELGHKTVEQQMQRQVRGDGSHFEQSSYYHVYALDMFLFHAILAPPSAGYRASLVRMAEYLDALLGTSRRLASIGDDDGGRFFHPYGARECFGRATMASCGVFLDRPEWIGDAADLDEQAVWWLGAGALRSPAAAPARASRCFGSSGVVVMEGSGTHAILDAGPFGPFRSGHSHADTLSLVIRHNDEELLIDPGTFTYVGSAEWREAFRGTAAHNTVRIDGKDQADPAGPFAWLNPPQVELTLWESRPECDEAEAVCRYRGFSHRRRVRFLKAGFLAILDEIEGPPGEHLIEQFWRPGSPASIARLVLEEPVFEEQGWRSTAFGSKQPSPVVCVRRRTSLPCKLAAAILIERGSSGKILRDGAKIQFEWRCAAGKPVTITF